MREHPARPLPLAGWAPEELLVTNKFDREIWKVGDEIWCVQRPRFFTVLVYMLWMSTAIIAILIGLACLAAVVFDGRRGGFFVWIALMAALAAYTLPRGVRAVKSDRALKRAPLAELARVQLVKARGELVEPDGIVVPLAQVTAKIVVDTSGDHDKHAVWLHYGDKRFHAMEFARDRDLNGTRDLLRELGIRIESER